MAAKENKPVATTTDEEEIILYIESNRDNVEKSKRPNRARIEIDLRLYESDPTLREGVKKWQSNRFIPATFKTIETILANIMGAIYSTNPPIDVRPRESGDATQAQIMKRVLAYDFDMIVMFVKLLDYIKQGLIYGTTFAKAHWDRRIEPKTIQVPIMGTRVISQAPFLERYVKGSKLEMQDVMTRNLPAFDVVDIRDIFMSPNSVDVQDDWIIHRTWTNYGSLLAKASQNIYDMNRVVKLKDIDIAHGQEEEDYSKRKIVNENLNEKTNELTHRLQVLEFWGQVPLKWIDPKGDKKKFIKAVITLAGAKGMYQVIRRQENPFQHGLNPFIKSTYIRQPKEPYGKSVPMIVGDLNLAINNLVNSRADNVMLVMQKVFVGLAGEFKADQTIAPGAILTENVPGALREMKMADITGSAYKDTFELERYLQEAAGSTQESFGAGGGKGRQVSQTATGMSLIFRAAATRMMMQAKQLEFESIKEIIQRFYQLSYQFRSPQDISRIVGERLGSKYVPVPPHEVMQDYDFIPAGTFTMENRDFQVQNMVAYYKITKGTPYINEKELVKKIGVEGFQFKPDDPMFPDEEQIAENAKRLVAMNEAGIGQGEGRQQPKPATPGTATEQPVQPGGGGISGR